MRAAKVISVIDYHAGGHPVRVITSGLGQVPGKTMRAKAEYVEKNMDWLRTCTIFEPRGHLGMFAAGLVAPTNPKADIGVIFMATHKYLEMCGHGTIGVVTALVENGLVEVKEPETIVTLEVPAGLVTARARVEKGSVTSVTFRNVPSFCYAMGVPVQLPGGPLISVDIAYGGNWYALLPVERIEGLRLELSSVSKLIALGASIKRAMNTSHIIRHPDTGEPHQVEHVRFHSVVPPDAPGEEAPCERNIVIPDVGKYDRSPCGTGTSARMAVLAATGMLREGEIFRSQGVLGSVFTGRFYDRTVVGTVPAIEPEISGRAFITGIHTLLIDDEDSLGRGFLAR